MAGSGGMAGSGCCRLCGGPLPPRKPGAGRPRSKCDACQDLRRPPAVPNWDSELVRAVQRDYPGGESDPFVYRAGCWRLIWRGRGIRGIPCRYRRNFGGLWLIWTIEGKREGIRMALMSFVCGGSMRGEWLPSIPLTGFEPSPIILLGAPSMILPERFCRFSVSSV
jgi:hypothetical protein